MSQSGNSERFLGEQRPPDHRHSVPDIQDPYPTLPSPSITCDGLPTPDEETAPGVHDGRSSLLSAGLTTSRGSAF